MVDNTRGILAMSAAVVVFIFNDALIKLAAESVPAVQAIGVRGLFATLWCALALLAGNRHAAFPVTEPRWRSDAATRSISSACAARPPRAPLE